MIVYKLWKVVGVTFETLRLGEGVGQNMIHLSGKGVELHGVELNIVAVVQFGTAFLIVLGHLVKACDK